MNGTVDTQPQSNQAMIKMVVFAVALNTTIVVGALGYCLVTGSKPDGTLLTAYVGLAGTFAGYLGGMLTKTTPTQTTQTPQPNETPAPVTIQQPTGSPVPVTEIEPKT